MADLGLITSIQTLLRQPDLHDVDRRRRVEVLLNRLRETPPDPAPEYLMSAVEMERLINSVLPASRLRYREPAGLLERKNEVSIVGPDYSSQVKQEGKITHAMAEALVAALVSQATNVYAKEHPIPPPAIRTEQVIPDITNASMDSVINTSGGTVEKRGAGGKARTPLRPPGAPNHTAGKEAGRATGALKRSDPRTRG